MVSFIFGVDPLQKIMLTINEFVERYGIGRTKTYEEINAGRLTAVKCGSRTLIPITSAEKWLNSLPLI